VNYFLYRLISPRPTFPADMTPVERKLMEEHAVYWRDLMNQGKVVAFGPVFDPKGVYGIAILRCHDSAEAGSLCVGDPGPRRLQLRDASHAQCGASRFF